MSASIYRYLTRLADSEADLKAAHLFYQIMKDEGVVDDLRNGPFDDSEAIFAEGPAGIYGMALFFQPVEQNYLWLDLLYVTPAVRRQGIGSALIDAVVNNGKVRALPVELGTFKTNTAMQRLCESLGFSAQAIIYRGAAA